MYIVTIIINHCSTYYITNLISMIIPSQPCSSLAVKTPGAGSTPSLRDGADRGRWDLYRVNRTGKENILYAGFIINDYNQFKL